MIVTQKVQKAMENQYLQLLGQGAAEGAGIAAGDFGRDGNVAQKFAACLAYLLGEAAGRAGPVFRGEGQNVGGFLFAAIGGVQASHFRVVDQAHGHGVAGKADFLFGALQKLFKRRQRHANTALVIFNCAAGSAGAAGVSWFSSHSH